jgi:hypothetical protein
VNRNRKMLTELESIGFVFDRRNSKGIEFWIHEDTGAEIKLVQNMDDSRCVSMLRAARQAIGLPTKDNKRNTDNIKERAHSARLEAQRAVEVAKANLAKYREANNEPQLRAAVELLEREERRFRYWDRLMRQAA